MRCSDCVYWSRNKMKDTNLGYCSLLKAVFVENWFCKGFERERDEDCSTKKSTLCQNLQESISLLDNIQPEEKVKFLVVNEEGFQRIEETLLLNELAEINKIKQELIDDLINRC